jgi:hypothetical protein
MPPASESAPLTTSSGTQMPPHCHAVMAANPAVSTKPKAEPAATARKPSRFVRRNLDLSNVRGVAVIITDLPS